MTQALKVAIAGLGTVGISTLQILQKKASSLHEQCGRPIEVVAVSARDRTRDRGLDLSGVQWFDDPIVMARHAAIDVFVELIGGKEGVAYSAILAALEGGRHVVTANKALLAHHGLALATLAEEKGVLLNFEAAVAGGIPIIKTMRESLCGNRASKIYGILNGTCNYILTRMHQKSLSFHDCLKEAQRLGYAETDPTFDIEGNDTAHKLALLTSLAFGSTIELEAIYCEGISNISLADIQAADELGYRIKLLGVATRTETGIEQYVHPTMIPISSALAQVQGATNAVSIQTDLLGELLLCGPGAGGAATASAVVGDLADIAKSRPGFQYAAVFNKPANALTAYPKAKMRAHAGGYFIRLSVSDRAGVFASIAGHMADNNISLESIVQRPKENQPLNAMHVGHKTIILITHETTEAAVRCALSAMTNNGYLIAKPQYIPIVRPSG